MINGVLFSVFFLPLAIFFTFISRRWLLRRARLSQGLRLPPGPPGLPLIGNFRDMPRGHPWITYAKWAEKYGMCTTITTRLIPLSNVFQATLSTLKTLESL